MTDKMCVHSHGYHSASDANVCFPELAKDCFFATGCVGALGTLAYSLVNVALSSTRDPSQLDVEIVIGYALIILGYLLVPGVGVLLVRRKRCLARNSRLLMAETDTGDADFLDTFSRRGGLTMGIFTGRQVRRDVERATKCVTWGSADDKEVQCSVCLNDVEEGSDVRVLPCGHTFHKECADLWLVNGRKNCCPLCMGRVCENCDANMVPVSR